MRLYHVETPLARLIGSTTTLPDSSVPTPIVKFVTAYIGAMDIAQAMPSVYGAALPHRDAWFYDLILRIIQIDS
jgi:hypothetical protein